MHTWLEALLKKYNKQTSCPVSITVTHVYITEITQKQNIIA